MTDQELEGFAAQAFNLARTEWKRKGEFNWLLASFHHGSGLHRMTKVEALVIQMAGEDWLNDPERQAQVGYVLRVATCLMPPDAIAVVSVADAWQLTDAFNALPKKDQNKILNGPREARNSAIALGLLTVEEVLVCMAQTPSRACRYQRRLDELNDAKPTVDFGEMAQLHGRFKFFEEVEIPPEMVEHLARTMAEKGYL